MSGFCTQSGRTSARARLVEGYAFRTSGHHEAMADRNVLIKANHDGYTDWAASEGNHRMLGENAHMQRRAARRSGRGGRAMRVFYKTHFGQSHGHRMLKPGRQFASDNSAPT